MSVIRSLWLLVLIAAMSGITHGQSPSPTVGAGMLTALDSTSPTGSSVWMWDESDLFLHVVGTTTTVQITLPSGAPITNIRGVISVLDPNPTSSATWIWNDTGVFLHVVGTTTTVEITQTGASIATVGGIMSAPDFTSPTGSSMWIWNDTGVFLHVTGTTTTVEITQSSGASISGVRGIINSFDATSPGCR